MFFQRIIFISYKSLKRTSDRSRTVASCIKYGGFPMYLHPALTDTDLSVRIHNTFSIKYTSSPASSIIEIDNVLPSGADSQSHSILSLPWLLKIMDKLSKVRRRNASHTLSDRSSIVRICFYDNSWSSADTGRCPIQQKSESKAFSS